MDYHIKVIADEFERRVQRNSRYSLRAFASALGLHPSALSRILAGKQDLSPQAALEVSQKLNLEKNEQRIFLQAVVNSRKHKTCEKLGKAIQVPALKQQPLVVSAETHARATSLNAVALMELTLTNDFQASAKWIAERLQIPEKTVNDLLSLLIGIGLLQSKGDVISKTQFHTTSVDSSTTSEIRKANQSEIMKRASDALATVPFEKRGHYAMTMAIDPLKVAEANRRIQQFHEELCDFLESGERTEVYQLATQLFPLSFSNQKDS